MRIAFLNKYQNKVMRGAETFVSELSKRLSKKNEVDVISDINYLKLIRGKYDVIIPTNGRFQVVIVRIISWLTGSKMVVSGQSGIGWDDKINLLSFPDAFVALSQKAQSWAKKFCPCVKSFYIPNGVDLNRFNKDLRSKSKIKTVLAVGAFTEQKRMDLVIDAVSKLENVKLIIAGGGGNLKKKLTDHGLAVLGPEKFSIISVPFGKMPAVYQSADVFTLPSRPSESFGNVLVEAMASGLPVVATDDPIRREIVGDAGLFVDPTDTEAYAKSLERALSIDWGEAPRRQAEKFSWDEIANEYESLFKKIA